MGAESNLYCRAKYESSWILCYITGLKQPRFPRSSCADGPVWVLLWVVAAALCLLETFCGKGKSSSQLMNPFLILFPAVLALVFAWQVYNDGLYLHDVGVEAGRE